MLTVGAAGALILLGAGILLRGRVPGIDVWALEVLTLDGDVGWAVTATGVVSDGLRVAAVVAAATAVGWLLWRERLNGLLPALGYAAVFVVLASSSELLKDVFGRTHPLDAEEVSLPSTHVTMVTVGLLVAAGVLWRLTGRWHAGATIVVALAIAATAATRVLLAEHHLTDVGATAAGYAGLALLCVGLLRYAGRPRPGRPAQAPA